MKHYANKGLADYNAFTEGYEGHMTYEQLLSADEAWQASYMADMTAQERKEFQRNTCIVYLSKQVTRAFAFHCKNLKASGALNQRQIDLFEDCFRAHPVCTTAFLNRLFNETMYGNKSHPKIGRPNPFKLIQGGK
jgi:hypothetical protein